MEKRFNSKTTKYIIGLLLIPLIWYIGINLLNGSSKYTFALIAILLTIFIVGLLVVRKLPLQNIKNIALDIEKPPTRKYYILTAVFMILMPMGGLVLNSGFSGFGAPGSGGVFGDFSSPVFYVIGLVNGLLLMIPPVKDTKLRLLLFYLKAAGFAYIIYFFIVFIPILPLGIIGLVFYGLGVFVWAPLAAALWQGVHMVKEWISLSRSWKVSGGQTHTRAHLSLTAILLIGLMTLPLFMTSVFLGDKDNFKTAAAYLNSQPEEGRGEVSLSRLKRALNNMKGDLQPARGFMSFSGGNTPIISDLYSRFILDGKVVSQSNLWTLENMFFDAGHNLSNTISNDGFVNHNVNLVSLDSETKYDKARGVYRTWVNLKLRNADDFGNSEYVTTFKLPEGAYVSDYYLDVLGRRKAGILSDRRAALFIYNKIVNTRKDPGLLHYVGRNTLELRVFPFLANEERLTGFEIIHKERFHLEIDGKTITANGKDSGEFVTFDGGVLLPGSEKAKLLPSDRRPEYYFVIDNSKNSDVKWHTEQVDAYVKANNITAAGVIFTNYKTYSHTLRDMDKVSYKAEFGFNLNLAVKEILRSHGRDSFPIIIAVSDNMPGAIFPRDTYPLADRYPESQYYYSLNYNLSLTPYSFDDNIGGEVVESPIISPALDYNGYYVKNNGKSEIVLTEADDGSLTQDAAKPDVVKGDTGNKVSAVITLTGNLYKDALILDAMQQRAQLGVVTDPINLVRSSFRLKILSPQTAFIVVETADQERELFDVQEKIMKDNMDPSIITLDEPPMWAIVLAVLLFLAVTKLKPLLFRSEESRA